MKQVKNFPNYLISENGDVFNKKTAHKIKWCKNTKGYLISMLMQSGKGKMVSAHRLVYTAYVGEIPKGYDINHIDGNKENNHYTNLDACTRKENIQKAVEIGLIKSGAESPLSKGVEQIDAWTGKCIAQYGSQREASILTGVSNSAISQCCRGNRITAGGYKWRFSDGSR